MVRFEPPDPKDWGVEKLIPHLRLRRGRYKRQCSLEEAASARCPVLWCRPREAQDRCNADRYVCYTWMGALIPASQWEERSIPISTPK